MPKRAVEVLQEVVRSPEHVAARLDDGPPLSSRVAVLPASFNPPTLAHLELLARASSVGGIRATACLLTTRNVDKGLYGARLEERAEMLLALDEPGLARLVSNAARIADQGLSLLNAFPGVDFDFVVGYDTLVRLFDLRYYEHDMHATLEPFFARHRLIAANRAQHDVEAVERFVATETSVSRYRDRIIVTAIPKETARISSTEARGQLAEGETSPHLPGEVAEYIRQRGLYRGER